MDFKDTLGSYHHLLPLEIIEVESSSRSNESKETEYEDNRWELAQNNEHLIDKCLITKRTDLLATNELMMYGKMALYSAANDFIFGLDFEDFALKRIERHMNVAIAEETYRQSTDVASTNKTDLQNEFQSIYKRFP